jgi:two-component system response regulator NreC
MTMRIKVLLVDDHKITRDGLIALIEKQSNMEVVGEADNGRDAIRLMKKSVPDVVIMDISMPDLNGIDATRQILAISPVTKVIALSMYSDRHYVEGMLSAGVSGYLIKNCAFDELVQAIFAVMSGQSYLSPRIVDIVMKDYANKLSGATEGYFQKNQLSSREREVLQLIAEGYNSVQIANKLYISIKTVSTHRRKIMEKLNINNIADLIKFAVREGLTST